MQPSKPKTGKAADKAGEREKVRQEKLEAQQDRKLAVEKKKLEKKRDAAMREAEREARRAAQPGECHRVCLEHNLLFSCYFIRAL